MKGPATMAGPTGRPLAPSGRMRIVGIGIIEAGRGETRAGGAGGMDGAGARPGESSRVSLHGSVLSPAQALRGPRRSKKNRRPSRVPTVIAGPRGPGARRSGTLPGGAVVGEAVVERARGVDHGIIVARAGRGVKARPRDERSAPIPAL